MSDKAIITCSITGVLTDPNQHHVPVTPEQLAKEARRAYDAGASVVHVHFRRQEEGKGHLPSWDPAVARACVDAMRAACPELIINQTTGVVGPDYQGPLDCLRATRPEMAACNAGSLNYLKTRSNGSWAWPPMLFDNQPAKVQDFLDVMAETQTLPEFECFDVGIVRCVGMYVETGMYRGLPEYNFVMGVESGMPADPDLLPILLELAGQHPQLDLSVTFNERKVDLIEANIDLVVRIGALEDQADLVARRLGEQRLIICGAPSYLARRGVPLTPDELSRHDCIIDWRAGHRHGWLLSNGAGKTEARDIPVRYEMGDGEAVRAAALAGLGLVQVPTWLVNEQLGSGALVSVLDDHSGGEMPINLLWARSQHMPLKVRVLVDALLLAAQQSGSAFRAN